MGQPALPRSWSSLRGCRILGSGQSPELGMSVLSHGKVSPALTISMVSSPTALELFPSPCEDRRPSRWKSLSYRGCESDFWAVACGLRAGLIPIGHPRPRGHPCSSRSDTACVAVSEGRGCSFATGVHTLSACGEQGKNAAAAILCIMISRVVALVHVYQAQDTRGPAQCSAGQGSC